MAMTRKELKKEVALMLEKQKEEIFRMIEEEGKLSFGSERPVPEGEDMKKRDLKGVVFEGTNLKDISLSGSNLENAVFKDVDLEGTVFENANLRGATFENVIFKGTRLFRSHLEGASFKNARFSGACLHSVKAGGANFENALFENTDLSRGDFSKGNFRKAKFSETSHLCGANFKEADLTKAVFENTSFDKVIFTGSLMKGVRIKDSRLPGSNFEGADLTDSVFEYPVCIVDCRFGNAKLVRAEFRGTGLQSANVEKADLKDSVFIRRGSGKPEKMLFLPEKGGFIGYERAHGYMVTLFIPEDAKRHQGSSRRCFCDKALVLSIVKTDNPERSKERIKSDFYVKKIAYVVGEEISAPEYGKEKGLMFFMNRHEAEVR